MCGKEPKRVIGREAFLCPQTNGQRQLPASSESMCHSFTHTGNVSPIVSKEQQSKRFDCQSLTPTASLVSVWAYFGDSKQGGEAVFAQRGQRYPEKSFRRGWR